MSRLLVPALIMSVGLLTAPAGLPERQQSTTDAVIALERSALDKWSKGDPSGFLSIYADDITYFDPMQERRIDDLKTMRALYEPLAGKFSIYRYEIMHPKVQAHGDIAVLTYNLRNFARQADGTEHVMSRWNSSSVYRRSAGKWQVIHSHWSFTKPDVRMPGA